MTTTREGRVVRARLDVSNGILRSAANAVDAALHVTEARAALAHASRKSALARRFMYMDMYFNQVLLRYRVARLFN